MNDSNGQPVALLALSRCKQMMNLLPYKLTTIPRQLRDYQKAQAILQRMATLFPNEFAYYSFLPVTRRQLIWVKALADLYYMANGTLFDVDWKIFRLTVECEENEFIRERIRGYADDWVDMPEDDEEVDEEGHGVVAHLDILKLDVFINRLPVKLYGFSEDEIDLPDYPPLGLMRCLLCPKEECDRFILGASLKQLGLTADLIELAYRVPQKAIRKRLVKIEKNPAAWPGLTGQLFALANYAISATGNDLLDRSYDWIDSNDFWNTGTVGCYFDINEDFPWTWSQIDVVQHLWLNAKAVVHAAERLTMWCGREGNLNKLASFLLTGDNAETLRAELRHL